MILLTVFLPQFHINIFFNSDFKSLQLLVQNINKIFFSEWYLTLFFKLIIKMIGFLRNS
jgi:hypothetical protein